MSRVFTDEQIQFVRDNHYGLRSDKLTEKVNAHFGTSFTQKQIVNLKKRHRLLSEYEGPMHEGHNFLFSHEQREFFLEHQAGKSSESMAELMNETFGLTVTRNQVAAYRKNHKVRSGRDTRFYKGQISHNKGKKNPCQSEKSKMHRFRKGDMPHNKLPIGSEVVATVGYLKVKIAEPNIWRFKHHLVWEQTHGRKVPRGHRIIFLDGDRMNCSPDNLMCVSKSAAPALRKKEIVGSKDPYLRKAALATAEVKAKLKQIEQKDTKKEE